MEVLLQEEGNNFYKILTLILNKVMQYERETVLQAGKYERTPLRKGYGNGYTDRIFRTMNGNLSLKIPQTRDCSFYPSILEKGIRSERALNLTIAEMYVKGVATRKVAQISLG